MRVLLVGNGAREHALAWKISQSPLLEQLFAAPGNPGIEQYATCLNIASSDINGLLSAVHDHDIDFVVIGPEDPLAMGLTDRLTEQGIHSFGPCQQAARIESSKAWAKAFMQQNGVPTAAYRTFTDLPTALAYTLEQEFPVVIKASGLAAGKGAVVAHSREEAEATLRGMLEQGQFGSAGQEVVVEAFLTGEEVSLLALVDGENIALLPAAQDHKQVFDGDLGPNTGGMGAFSPVGILTPELEQQALEQIIRPVVKGLADLGTPYRGVLYAGLMLTSTGPQVIEFNARFGDPETQVILPRLESDLLQLMYACATGQLASQDVLVRPEACATVIMAAPGYPGPYQKGIAVEGIDNADDLGCLVFQAGTIWADSSLVSNGGRILAVTALGDTLEHALRQAYAGVESIRIPGVHYRTDIGNRRGR